MYDSRMRLPSAAEMRCPALRASAGVSPDVVLGDSRPGLSTPPGLKSAAARKEGRQSERSLFRDESSAEEVVGGGGKQLHDT